MEAVTAFIEGPACFLIVFAILYRKAFRYVAIMLVSTGQLYGDVLYYATCFHVGEISPGHCTMPVPCFHSGVVSKQCHLLPRRYACLIQQIRSMLQLLLRSMMQASGQLLVGEILNAERTRRGFVWLGVLLETFV